MTLERKSKLNQAINIALESGYDFKKSVLLVLECSIKEYEYLKKHNLRASAERVYSEIEYLRAKIK